MLPPTKKNAVRSQQDSAKKVVIPEQCRLCFGALHKAIAVFNNSLSSNQPPEVFISHSKLIIMVGQKIVDSLCQDTQLREARSDVLHSSSRFCSLLKNLALATKNAAIQYPNADAMRELQNKNDELYKYTQQFRAMLEWVTSLFIITIISILNSGRNLNFCVVTVLSSPPWQPKGRSSSVVPTLSPAKHPCQAFSLGYCCTSSRWRPTQQQMQEGNVELNVCFPPCSSDFV